MSGDKIFPRNLTARAALAASKVIGNPVTTMMESGVANCFPGLEFDVRILDCRFFPGLVFQFIVPPKYPAPDAIPNQHGARLLYTDYLLDPMLPETSREPWVQNLLDQYGGPLATTFMSGRWYLDWIEQNGRRLPMRDTQGNYLDGYTVWRLVRGLEAGRVEIGIERRDPPAPGPAQVVVLSGYRRQYVNAAGLFDEAFRPGEFTQSMCNPWTHDFRDCACHYWASNHPDVVTGGPLMSDNPSDARDPAAAQRLDWLRRRDGSSEVSASATIAENRVYQIDHYEINQSWEKLPFVLEGHEIDRPYRPPLPKWGEPHQDAAWLIRELENELAGMEMALVIEYLYALFSLRHPDEATDPAWPSLADDLRAVRQSILMVAVGEMTHLRWVNQMLWLLDRAGINPGWHYTPVVSWSNRIRIADRATRLAPLTPDVLKDFVQLERPSGYLTGVYEKCVATLKDEKYPRAVFEIALRIDGEGGEHYRNFCNVQRILSKYPRDAHGEYPYLRSVTPQSTPETRAALAEFDAIRRYLASAYNAEARGDMPGADKGITDARAAMVRLQASAEQLAQQGLGIPFLDPRS
ncbi:ferritin-like domain-containing protein [Bradyrhizobium sp. CER78]|uniref:ferritin-like domain-containing protein n=1 Tax=Bradyrhizobium sp. CER78 TaxID=3039162 RepID=UPI002447F1FD|nr:ferritin-like domain-containing protein [Bradyrhizobium sp. CER78]MDH2380872.1 ferritin-like domain-containing protein [Bradyrhizobium sp. CER78]